MQISIAKLIDRLLFWLAPVLEADQKRRKSMTKKKFKESDIIKKPIGDEAALFFDYPKRFRRKMRQLGSSSNRKKYEQIYWNGNAAKIKCSEQEMHDHLKYCKEHYRKSTGSKTMLRDWPKGSYRMQTDKYSAKLFVRDENGNLFWYYVNAKSKNTNEKDDAQGKKAITLANEYCKKNYGKPLVSIYGTTAAEFRFCTPKQFYYRNIDLDGKILNHMSCIDASSQYPSGFLGDMPTAKGNKALKGTVKPTEEYPFAFYLKSGHLAIYNELDTHDWLFSPFAEYLFQDEKAQVKNLDPDQDVTVLMRKAEINPLAKFFDEQFKIKETFDHDSEEYKDAKLVMNALIGMMHQKTFNYNKSNWKLAHLPAIAIARGNQKILNQANQIGIHNIAMIVVDSIIYQGKKEFGSHEKYLGSMHQEVTDAQYRHLKTSTYAFFKDGACVKFKHGSSNATIDDNEIETPKTLFEMDNYVRRRAH